MHKWFVIAKNEYRLRMSGVRVFRPYFPIVAIALVAIYIFFIAPKIFGLFSDTLLAFFLSQAAVASIQLILFNIFLIFVVYPIIYTLQQSQISQYEILLSAPLNSRDVLLGKFLGDMIFYAVVIAFFAGTFAAVLGPFGLSHLQIAIIILIFILIFFSALWIGTVIASILRTKLAVTARGRDIGKALAMIIALPLVALMYAIMSGSLQDIFADPEANRGVRFILDLLPSSWGAQIIVDFVANPGNIAANWYDLFVRLSSLVLFLLAVLWIGAKVSDRAMSLEPASFSGARAKPDGIFYSALKLIVGGGSFGTLLASIFKDFGRRFENISKLIYMIGLIILIRIFFGSYGESEPDIIGTLIIPFGILPFLSVFVVGEVTIRGKDNLFIYRKAPNGEARLIKARLIQGWLFMVPITIGIVFFSLLIIPDIQPLEMYAYIVIITFIEASYIAFALGLFLLKPVFTEKPADLMGNAMAVMMLAFLTFLFSIIYFGETMGIIVTLILGWGLGLSLLYLGKRNLYRLE